MNQMVTCRFLFRTRELCHPMYFQRGISQMFFPRGGKLWTIGVSASTYCKRNKDAMLTYRFHYRPNALRPLWVDGFSKQEMKLQASYHQFSGRSLLLKIIPHTYSFLQFYSSKKETIEKQLLHLMDMWELEDAVALLRESIEDGVIPHTNVVLNLQQQLANLGEVECLLELHDFLKEHNLLSDASFFHCLQEAYYNSGRISEGVAVLRLLYHRTRKFSDVEVYFTLLTVMVIKDFPQHLELIQSFVTDLKDAEEAVLEPEASLWKCYIMMGKWSEADDVLLNNEQLRALLPKQVTRICHGVDRVQCDRVATLIHLLQLPFIREKLRVLVAETLIPELISQNEWAMMLKVLKQIKSLSLPLHGTKLLPALNGLQHHLTPQYHEQIEELKLWCDSLESEEKH